MRTISLGLVTSLLITNTCMADGPTCQDTLAACDGAYQSQKVLIKDLKEQVGNLSQKNILQDRIIQDQKSSLDDPLKNPVIVGVGAVAATVVLLLISGHTK